MSTIINFPLIRYNTEQSQRFLADANQRNAELFFAVGVDVNTKDMHLFYNSAGGMDRVLDTMKELVKALEISKAKAKK